jgi:hypothetical protein
VALAPKQLGVIGKPIGSIRITLLALELQINFRYAARLFDEGGDLGQVPADVGVLHWLEPCSDCAQCAALPCLDVASALHPSAHRAGTQNALEVDRDYAGRIHRAP